MPKKNAESTQPKFPYTNQPKALRRLLAEIPKRPKPSTVTMDTLKGWNVSNNNNARTAIRVLKTIGLLDSSGAPTENYVEFMKTGTGPGALGQRIKESYRVLFENSLTPQNETDEELKKLFNIHSGGGDEAMRLQVQTFKALTEYATFDAQGDGGTRPDGNRNPVGATNQSAFANNLPPIKVDLHIHLPENKTSRDYEAIIQDIAKYIYGREIDKT